MTNFVLYTSFRDHLKINEEFSTRWLLQNISFHISQSYGQLKKSRPLMECPIYTDAEFITHAGYIFSFVKFNLQYTKKSHIKIKTKNVRRKS